MNVVYCSEQDLMMRLDLIEFISVPASTSISHSLVPGNRLSVKSLTTMSCCGNLTYLLMKEIPVQIRAGTIYEVWTERFE